MKILTAASANPPALRWANVAQIDGRMPIWDKAQNQQDQTQMRLASAQQGHSLESGTSAENAPLAARGSALAYAPAARAENEIAENAFGFGDLVDMVNPLQHVPLLSTAYRHITGDEIRPVGRIIGGGLYGGPLGAASGLVNIIAQQETGRDVGENIVALLTRDRPDTITASPAMTSAPHAFRISAAESLIGNG